MNLKLPELLDAYKHLDDATRKLVELLTLKFSRNENYRNEQYLRDLGFREHPEIY